MQTINTLHLLVHPGHRDRQVNIEVYNESLFPHYIASVLSAWHPGDTVAAITTLECPNRREDRERFNVQLEQHLLTPIRNETGNSVVTVLDSEKNANAQQPVFAEKLFEQLRAVLENRGLRTVPDTVISSLGESDFDCPVWCARNAAIHCKSTQPAKVMVSHLGCVYKDLDADGQFRAHPMTQQRANYPPDSYLDRVTEGNKIVFDWGNFTRPG